MGIEVRMAKINVLILDSRAPVHWLKAYCKTPPTIQPTLVCVFSATGAGAAYVAFPAQIA